jgi:hypothetical protein
VPWTHALELANALKSDDVVFTLIKDGDHRLSRPQDLERLVAAVAEAKGLANRRRATSCPAAWRARRGSQRGRAGRGRDHAEGGGGYRGIAGVPSAIEE